jgi:hypothetical protein
MTESKELVPVPGITQLAKGRNPRGASRASVMFPVASYLEAHKDQDLLDAQIADALGLVLSSVQKVLSVFVREHPHVRRVRPRTYRYSPKNGQAPPAKALTKAPAKPPAAPRPDWAFQRTGLHTASGEEIVADKNRVAHVVRPVL